MPAGAIKLLYKSDRYAFLFLLVSIMAILAILLPLACEAVCPASYLLNQSNCPKMCGRAFCTPAIVVQLADRAQQIGLWKKSHNRWDSNQPNRGLH